MENGLALIPPGMATLHSTARHLRLTLRHVYALAAGTPLDRIERLALGRARGSYRLVPPLGIAALRQRLSAPTWHLEAWDAALNDLLHTRVWNEALHALAGALIPATPEEGPRDETGGDSGGDPHGSEWVERVLIAPEAMPSARAMLNASFAALERHGLADAMQVEPLVVDRLEDAEDAVVLVGLELRAYLLPRDLLRVAGLDREKARGVLMATRTGAGVALDVWPAVGAAPERAWRPDPALLEHLYHVGRQPGAAAGVAS